MNKGKIFVVLLIAVALIVGWKYYNTSKENESEVSYTETDLPNVIKNTNETTAVYQTDKKIMIQTDIEQEESLVTKCRTIDEELTKELISGKYTFDYPMIIRDPYQASPLSAMVLFFTDEMLYVKSTVIGDTSWEGSDYSGETTYAKEHHVPILGLYPGRINKVRLELFNEKNKKVGEKIIEIQTDPLPEKMQNMVTVYQSGKDTALPLILVTGQQSKNSFAFDKKGDIRWYLSQTSGSYGIFPISGGKFIFQDANTMVPTYEKPHTTKMYEMDYLGRVYKVYYIENGCHHEVIEKEPGGNFLMLSSSLDDHVEDTVVEMDRETGRIVKELDMRKIFGDTYVDMIDWAHLNTIDYNAEENTVILSPRNVHSVIKVDWKTNQLIWILANPEFWKGTPYETKVLQPEGDIIWHFQQHSTYQIRDMDDNPDTIQLMLYDNHWDKTRVVDFFDKDPNSYVMQYTIDEKNMTVCQDHLYTGVKSKITSNFVLKYKENRVFSMGGYLDPEIDGNNGMIYEFTYDTEKVVNQYAIKKTFYRAYAFEPDYNVLSTKFKRQEQWNYGTLRALQYIDRKIEIPTKKMDETAISLKVSDEFLYVNAKDHDVTAIYLVGDNCSYGVDYSDTLPGEDTYENVSYNVASSLSPLNYGTYHLILMYNGELVDTGKTVTVKIKIKKAK